jgi:osmotically-inducible protein OsmY
VTTPKKHEIATRPDVDIAREVLRRMKADIEVPDDRVQAKTENGVVTLSGAVARDEQKLAAGNCVRRVKGVRDIRNQIEVEPSAAVVEA